MNVETVTGPISKLREQVLRLGERVVTQSRHAGEVALRGGASALTRTAQRLDTLADRIADGETTAKDAAEAPPNADAPRVDAMPPTVEDAKPATPAVEDAKPATPEVSASAETGGAEVEAAEAEGAEVAPADAANAEPAAHGASTPEARPQGGSKKKHRHNHRPR